MSTWDNQEKAGNTQGWEYDESNLLYDSLSDPDSGLAVLYNGMGTSSSFTNVIKN